MIEFFSAIQFANLAAFAAAAFIPLLALAYLRRKRKESELVSSILILQQLSKKKVLQRRFKPPFRFFLELLALLLLMLAATLPSLSDTKGRVALLIDNSFSMRAKSKTSSTRFEEALRAADSWLSEQDSSNIYSLFISSPKLERLGNREISRRATRSLLASQSAGFASDALDTAVKELAETGDFDRVVIFTDRSADFTTASLLENSQSEEESTRIEIHTVGSPVPNAYLVHLSASLSGVSSRPNRIRASFGYSGNTPFDAEAQLTLLRTSDNRKTKNPLQKKALRLLPNQTTELSFDLPENTPDKAIFLVELFAQASVSKTTLNALSEDDSGWISSEGSPSSRILLVTPQQSDDSLGLEQVPSLQLSSTSPTDFAQSPADFLSQHSLLIFHKTAPTEFPKQPTLLILPPTENPLFPVAKEVEDPQISSWTEEHPITSYLRLELLKPKRAAVFSTPLWAQSILNVEEGSILLAGESRGIRFASVGIEILPFEKRKTPTLSILTLNIINWISGKTELSTGYLSGDSFRIEANSRWIIQTPDQKIDRFAAEDKEVRFYPLKKPGLYEVSALNSSGTTKETLTVNSFHPFESSTFQTTFLVVPEYVHHPGKSVKSAKPLWGTLLGLILALIVLEFFIFLFSKRFAKRRKPEGKNE